MATLRTLVLFLCFAFGRNDFQSSACYTICPSVFGILGSSSNLKFAIQLVPLVSIQKSASVLSYSPLGTYRIICRRSVSVPLASNFNPCRLQPYYISPCGFNSSETYRSRYLQTPDGSANYFG